MQSKLSLSPYLQNLQNNSEQFQFAIEGLLEKYQVQPVGAGYIDLIIEKEKSIDLINELSKIYTAVDSLSWWCKFTIESGSKYGCPHGMGGPKNKFGDGIFSECVQYPIFSVLELPNSIDENSMSPEIFVEKCNELVVNYIKNILPSEKFYSPCLHVGLWMRVPNDWQRKYYLL